MVHRTPWQRPIGASGLGAAASRMSIDQRTSRTSDLRPDSAPTSSHNPTLSDRCDHAKAHRHGGEPAGGGRPLKLAGWSYSHGGGGHPISRNHKWTLKQTDVSRRPAAEVLQPAIRDFPLRCRLSALAGRRPDSITTSRSRAKSSAAQRLLPTGSCRSPIAPGP